MRLHPSRNKVKLFTLYLFIILTLGTYSAFAQTPTSPIQTRLTGLSWTQQSFSEENDQLIFQVSGIFNRPHWSLLFLNQAVRINLDQSFQVSFRVPQQEFDVKTMAIGPLGQVETNVFHIRVPDSVWNQHLESKSNNNPKRFGLSANVGFTYLSYQEEVDHLHLTEVTLTAKANAHYVLLPNQFTLSASIFANLVPLYFSSDTTTDRARFFGFSGRIGYQLPIHTPGVTWSLIAGWYTWGMMVPNDAYGVKQLGGPMVMLHAKFPTWFKRPSSAYLKYAPISAEPGQFSLQYRELAFGFAHQLTSLSASRDWTLTLDIAQTKAASVEAGNSLNLLSVSLGIQSTLF